MRLTLVLWLVSGVTLFAQDWQATYQASVNAYKNQDFSEAIARAEDAVALSKDLDTKAKAFSLQIFTASCLESSRFEKVFEACDQEIELFKSLEAEGKNHVEAIRKKGKLLMLASRPHDAVIIFHDLSTLLGKNSKDVSYFKSLADEADALLQAGRVEDARRLYQECIPGFRQHPDAGEDYLFSLFNVASIDFQLKDFTSSSKKLHEFISVVESNNLKDIPEYEEARKMLSRISMESGTGDDKLLVADDQLKKLFQAAMRQQQTQVDLALVSYQNAERVIVRSAIANNTAFSVYTNYARLLYALGRYDSASHKLGKAMSLSDKLFPPESREIALLRVLEGDLLMERNRKMDAWSRYQGAMQVLKSEPAEVLARQTRWIGEQLFKAGLASECRALILNLDESFMLEKMEVVDRISLEKLYLTAAIDLRDLKDAKLRCEKKLGASKDPATRQGYLMLYAQAEREDGNLTQALSNVQQALALNGNGSLDSELQLEIGRLHQQLGNYKEAELAYSQAVDSAPKSPSAQVLLPQVYNSFATFYIQLGNYAAAEKLFQKLLARADDQAIFYNAVRQNFAAMYQQLGRYQEAKRLLLQAVEADRQLFGQDHPDYAIALQNLASAYQKMGKTDSAFLLMEQALAIDKKYYGDNSLNYAAKLANMGALYQDQSNFSKALQLYESALEIRKLKLHAEHPDYNYNLFTIGYLFYRTHQLEKAAPYLRESSGFYLRQIRDVFPVLSDYERTAFYNRLQSVIQGYQMFMVEYAAKNSALAGELMNFRLETKALLLNASLKVRTQILASADQELISKFSVWQHTKEQLAFLYTLTAAEQEGHQALIAEYKDKGNELEKWLSQKSEAFATAVNLPIADWKKIQQSLKPNEAAVEIIRTTLPNDSVLYAAMILKPNATLPQMVILHDGKMLENKMFKLYINSIRFQLEDKRSYDEFWKDIDMAIAGTNVLYLSGDGVFNKVNPLTFYDPHAQQYVLDKMKVQLVSNLKDLLSRRRESTPRESVRNALLLGFPDYRLNSTLQAKDIKANDATTGLFFELIKSGVTDLLGTLHEINEVKSSLEKTQWEVSSHIREAATEEKVKATKNPTLIHIATHGFFITSSKRTNTQVHGTDIANIDNNVMLRSGVLLAGAEKNLLERMSGKTDKNSEDGVLTAFEIMNLNLDSTQLVVLSACETGIGDIRNGEGVYGLQRAFLLAGAKAVIMSLWKVDDEATRYLMSNFYNEWTVGQDRAQAFYVAQKQLRKQFAHPYFWGAFVISGEL